MDLFRYLLFLFVFANTRCMFGATLWSPVGGRTDLLAALLNVMVSYFLSLSYSVSWVRCGT